MNRPERLFIGLLVVALAGAGLAYYRAQTRQAATLARFTKLEHCLIISNKQRALAAKNTLFDIATAVNKNHHQARDMAVLQQAQKICGRTKILLDTLRQLRQTSSHHTELRKFPTQLAQYVVFIRRFVPHAPLLSHASHQDEPASWLSEFDAAREPKTAGLALLTKLETQVRQVEAEALISQAQKVGYSCGFDKIGAVVIPASETVAPGTVYQAQLLLVQAAASERTHFSANGHEVPINPATGKALAQFNVPAASPGQPDTVRAAWHGRVQLPWAAGDTVLETTVPYFIVKPPQH